MAQWTSRGPFEFEPRAMALTTPRKGRGLLISFSSVPSPALDHALVGINNDHIFRTGGNEHLVGRQGSCLMMLAWLASKTASFLASLSMIKRYRPPPPRLTSWILPPSLSSVVVG